MKRRRYVLAAVVLVAAGAAIALAVTVTGRGSSHHGPTKEEYLAAVSTACSSYARRIARVPAPANVTAYGDVVSSIRQVLPLLRKQQAAMEAIEAPAELGDRVVRLFALNIQSVQHLDATLAAAQRRDAGEVIEGLGAFSNVRDEVHALSLQLGIHCE